MWNATRKGANGSCSFIFLNKKMNTRHIKVIACENRDLYIRNPTVVTAIQIGAHFLEWNFVFLLLSGETNVPLSCSLLQKYVSNFTHWPVQVCLRSGIGRDTRRWEKLISKGMFILINIKYFKTFGFFGGSCALQKFYNLTHILLLIFS